MPNRKMIALRTLELSYHPLLEQVIKDDYYPLTKQTQLSCLSDQEISRLLEQITLPVICHPTLPSQYYLLAPATDFLFLKQCSHTMTQQVQLNIYPLDEAEAIIETLSFIHPCLQHGLLITSLQNISKRYQLAKQHQLSPPTKKKMAVIADTSPTAIRH